MFAQHVHDAEAISCNDPGAKGVINLQCMLNSHHFCPLDGVCHPVHVIDWVNADVQAFCQARCWSVNTGSASVVLRFSRISHTSISIDDMVSLPSEWLSLQEN